MTNKQLLQSSLRKALADIDNLHRDLAFKAEEAAQDCQEAADYVDDVVVASLIEVSFEIKKALSKI